MVRVADCDGLAGSQRPRDAVHGRGLDADDPDSGPEVLQRQCDAGQQAAAARGDEDLIDIRRLADEFQADGPCPAITASSSKGGTKIGLRGRQSRTPRPSLEGCPMDDDPGARRASH